MVRQLFDFVLNNMRDEFYVVQLPPSLDLRTDAQKEDGRILSQKASIANPDFWEAIEKRRQPVMPRRDTLYDDLPAFLLPQVRR
jgi:hypothetical protein